MDPTFLKQRITRLRATIVIYEDAIDALATDSILTYKIDTGQTVNTVTKQDLGSLQRQLDGLYSRCAVFETRLNGAGVHTARPSW